MTVSDVGPRSTASSVMVMPMWERLNSAKQHDGPENSQPVVVIGRVEGGPQRAAAGYNPLDALAI